jgi:ubiquitin-conjugating enzyme E2 variant
MMKRLGPLLGSNYHYPVWNRLMELGGIALYGLFALLLGGELVSMALRPDDADLTWLAAAWLLPIIILAFLAGDFASGFVHCAADNFGHPTTPVFGVAFIRPFRDHHRDPLDITRHDFVETNGNSCIVNLTVVVPAYFALGGEPSLGKLLLGALALLFTVSIVMTNQIHKWAHSPRPPWAVSMLQRYGVILSPDNHAVHHTSPFDKNYCITTGWMNGIIERVGFFAWLVRTFK